MPRAESLPGTQGEATQLALPLHPTVVTPALRSRRRGERMLADYRLTSVSVSVHPLALLREQLPAGVLTINELTCCRDGRPVRVAGMAIARQRPSTAKGVVFICWRTGR